MAKKTKTHRPSPPNRDRRTTNAAAIELELAIQVRRMPLTSRRIHEIVHAVWTGERGDDIQLSVAVVGDCRMAGLAETYAGRRYRTDVFAFELTDEGEPIRSAQIVLNAALARDVAKRTGGAANGELAMYLIHGLLHLCGYDDHDDDEAHVMHRRGMEYLKLLGYRITAAMDELTRR